MTSLEDIPGLDAALVPVLQTAGIDTPADFAVVPAKVIRRALEKALEGRGVVPTIEDVEGWQNAVRSGFRAARMEAVKEAARSNYSKDDPLPVAEALSSQQLMSSGIPASAVPAARILGDPTEANLEVAPRMGEEERGERESVAPPVRENGRMPEQNGLLPEKKPQEVNEVEVPFAEPVERVEMPPMVEQVYEEREVDEEDEEEEVRPMAFHSTTDRSREAQDFSRKNRGMTHKDPGRVWRGAMATLLTLVLVTVGVATVVTASVMEFVMKKQVPVELAFGLAAFPLALIVFVWLGTPPRCRLCGQRLFMPRSCLRHERAHRSLFGYGVALASHVIFRGWFRCSLCGTKQKLR